MITLNGLGFLNASFYSICDICICNLFVRDLTAHKDKFNNIFEEYHIKRYEIHEPRKCDGSSTDSENRMTVKDVRSHFQELDKVNHNKILRFINPSMN